MNSYSRRPFTAAQLDELQHQAFIFNHLASAAPPPLPLPLAVGVGVGYPTYYSAKKLDPEPGRCRRTDGKKWRCAKDAHPDSKYCDRHMHRTKRSRKPVESAVSKPQPTVAGAGFRSFQSVQTPQRSAGSVDLGCYGSGNRECGSPYGVKAVADEHGLFSEPSGNARGLRVDTSLDISWGLLPSQVPSPLSKVKNSTALCTYPQFHSVQDLDQVSLSSLSKPQQQYSFFGCDFGSPEPLKLDSQPLRPFFDEWPRAKDAWSDLEDERSNHNSFSNIQLAMSIPMASSDFSTTTSTSLNDD